MRLQQNIENLVLIFTQFCTNEFLRENANEIWLRPKKIAICFRRSGRPKKISPGRPGLLFFWFFEIKTTDKGKEKQRKKKEKRLISHAGVNSAENKRGT